MFSAGNYLNFTYDKIGQLKTAKGYESDGTPRLQEQFGYAYDAAWNLARRTNNALTQTFNVDSRNQLTGGSRNGTLTVAGTVGQPNSAATVTVSGTGLGSGAATVYADGTWARAGATLADGANTYTATAADDYGRTSQDSVSFTLPALPSFTYDGNGNLTSDGLRTFEYDFENQLTNVYVTAKWRSEFVYDTLMRRRTRKEYTWLGNAWVQTNEVRYVYDQRLVLQERWFNPQVSLATPQRLVTYTRGKDLSGELQEAGGIGGLLARSETALQQGDPGSAHVFYVNDANGNITALINSKDVVVARYQYDPYGNLLSMSGPMAEANLYRFSSKEVHPNSGLVYYLYRYYEPSLQRWINRDPLEEEDDINLYRTVRNAPVDGWDPYGLQCCLQIPPILLEPPPVVPPRILLGPPRPSAPPCGLRPNPFGRPGSWGRTGSDGKFQELWRFDKGTPGKPGWGGKDHFHLNGEKPHLPIDTPFWLRPDGTFGHNAPPVNVVVPPGVYAPIGKQESPQKPTPIIPHNRARELCPMT